jgi:hypothetical protein
MAKSSTAKKVIAVPPKIHPEILAEINKKKINNCPTPRVHTPRKKSRGVRLVSAKAADSVIDQTRIAFSVSVIGSITGLILGSVVPTTTYMISHYEWKEWLSIYTVLVVGGLAFSAKTVFLWGKSAFRDTAKALGFVTLVETAMIFSHIRWVNLLGLSILVGINAVATGANLVIKPEKKPSWES